MSDDPRDEDRLFPDLTRIRRAFIDLNESLESDQERPGSRITFRIADQDAFKTALGRLSAYMEMMERPVYRAVANGR